MPTRKPKKRGAGVKLTSQRSEIQNTPPKKMEFRFTGKVTPGMVSNATNPVVPISYRLDNPLKAAIVKAYPNKTGVADYAVRAIDAHLEDLDSVLLAVLETAARQKENVSSQSMMKLDAIRAAQLQEATEFLTTKGYKRVGRGKLLAACVLLLADKEGVIPSWEKEREKLVLE